VQFSFDRTIELLQDFLFAHQVLKIICISLNPFIPGGRYPLLLRPLDLRDLFDDSLQFGPDRGDPGLDHPCPFLPSLIGGCPLLQRCDLLLKPSDGTFGWIVEIPFPTGDDLPKRHRSAGERGLGIFSECRAESRTVGFGNSRLCQQRLQLNVEPRHLCLESDDAVPDIGDPLECLLVDPCSVLCLD